MCKNYFFLIIKLVEEDAERQSPVPGPACSSVACGQGWRGWAPRRQTSPNPSPAHATTMHPLVETNWAAEVETEQEVLSPMLSSSTEVGDGPGCRRLLLVFLGDFLGYFCLSDLSVNGGKFLGANQW
ncbi:hypothetical protein C2845_PM01G44280 [Panicum miliaceum]|uniref:Uncharacterized protein n=1 Tax=Panicum miliaceum TaxID=4540 RepID=A0A3L6TFX1_PANMI|nr:hypothetical protein C2845_PM01G44280 [Panicum miliaceum]